MWSSRTWVSTRSRTAPPEGGRRPSVRVEQKARYPTPPTSITAPSGPIESSVPESFAIIASRSRPGGCRPSETPPAPARLVPCRRDAHGRSRPRARRPHPAHRSRNPAIAAAPSAVPGPFRHAPARPPEPQGRGRVLVHEGFLDRRLVRTEAPEHITELPEQRDKPFGQRAVGRRVHDTIADMGQPIRGDVDDPPSGTPQAGIEPENPHLPFPRRRHPSYRRKPGSTCHA